MPTAGRGGDLALTATKVTPAFVGRSRELNALGGALSDARAASPRVVLVKGPAGIGKTVLVRRFLAELAESVVVRASGEEAEKALPYGVLDQLWAAAGAHPVGDVSDPLAAGAAFLELLGELQESGPVVLTVDDAHWSDTPSLHALTFALRRLRVDRVLAVLVVRTEETWHVPDAVERLVDTERGLHLVLQGMTPSELAALARKIGAGTLTEGAARRLYSHTGGNPLYASALLREIGGERLGRPSLDPLPAPRSYAAVVLDRVSSCAPQTQRLVESGAVLGVRWPLELGGRVAGVEDALGAAQEATEAGLLVTADGGRGSVEFAHPLVQAAVYHGLGPGERAALHTRAAALTGDVGRALRHRAAAASGADPALANDLRAFARAQAGRRAWSAAADASLSASRLSSETVEAERLFVDAFEFLMASGDLARAFTLADEAEAWDESARRCYVLGAQAFLAGRPAQGESLLAEAWERCDPPSEPVLAARIAGMNAGHHLNTCEGEKAVAWAERALQWDPDGAASTSYPPRLLLRMSLGAAGHDLRQARMSAGLPDPLPDPDANQVGELLGRGVLRLWSDDLVGAAADLASVAGACRRRGPLTLAINALFYLADAEYRLGRWDDSGVHAELAVSAADDSGFAPGVAFSHSAATFVLSGRGDLDLAAEHARRALDAAVDPAQVLWAAVGAARVAQAGNDAQRQATACEPVLEHAGKEPLEEPGVLPWRELYSEALVRLGRLDEADAVLRPLDARVERTDRSSARYGLWRVRGLLAAAHGDAERADTAFGSALAAADLAAMPFAGGQVELDWGSFLRRRGRRRAALARLKSAHATFSRLEARPFLERCERELEALGLSPASGGQRSISHLTPQERSVAHLVATGMTNREIAAELMLSVKTVEHHLGNVFAKLHVRSRAQMTARLAESSLHGQQE